MSSISAKNLQTRKELYIIPARLPALMSENLPCASGANRERAHEHEPRVLLQEAPTEQVCLDIRDPKLRGK